MIYDAFIFFNELDLLEIRLNILNPVVDKFVIVEGNKTFSNKPKPLYFEINRNRYKEFLPKIIHVEAKLPNGPDNWERERYQRNAISQGLGHCNPNDTIMISDVDEIPASEQVKPCNDLVVCHQLFYYYYLNCRVNQMWQGTRILPYSRLQIVGSPQRVRESGGRLVEGGWHFSYLGGWEKVKEKIESFSHQEYNKHEYINEEHLKFSMKCWKDLFNRADYTFSPSPVEMLPLYLQQNFKKYPSFFREGI